MLKFKGSDFSKIALLASENSDRHSDTAQIKGIRKLPELSVELKEVKKLLEKTGKPYQIKEDEKLIIVGDLVVRYL